MPTRARSLVASILAAAISSFASARVQPEAPANPVPDQAAPPGMTFDKKSIAAMLAQHGGPAEEHQLLEPLVGKFDVEIRMSILPGQPPLIAHARCEAEWIMGGRFVQAHTRPAADEELKIESQSTFGFDKRMRKFFWIGIDSTDTYAVFAQGDYDKDSKTFTLLGENDEPGTGKVPFKAILQIVNDDERLFQVWFQLPGAKDAEAWFKVMEASYKRAE